MEPIYSFLKAISSTLISVLRLVASIRARGAQFYPILSKEKNGTYLVEAWFKPGRDDVMFDTFIAKGCDIQTSNKPLAPVFKDKAPIRFIVASSFEAAGDSCLTFHIRPRSKIEKVHLSVKGGWLNQLNATRYLVDTTKSSDISVTVI